MAVHVGTGAVNQRVGSTVHCAINLGGAIAVVGVRDARITHAVPNVANIAVCIVVDYVGAVSAGRRGQSVAGAARDFAIEPVHDRIAMTAYAGASAIDERVGAAIE